MSNFKIGEKVICINPIYNLQANKIYKIFNIKICNNCGLVCFELDQPKITGKKITNYSKCNCGKDIEGHNLFSISRFRKLDYDFAENLLAEIKEQVSKDFILN